MRKLYEIKTDMQLALDMVDPETGEWLGAEKYAALIGEEQDKLEGVAISIKEDAADIDALDREIQNLTARRDRIAKARAGKIGWLDNQLQGKPFSTSRVEVRYRKSQCVEIDDEESFCRMCYDTCNNDFVSRKETITYKPNRAAIAKFLKAGGELPGARIQTNLNMKVG